MTGPKLLDLLAANSGALTTLAQQPQRLGCPLEDCPESVPAIGDVAAALNAHAAVAHRQLIDYGHGAELAHLIRDWTQAAGVGAVQSTPASIAGGAA